jgi:acetyl esterase/lipase
MPKSFFSARPTEEVEAVCREKTTFIGGVSLEGQKPSSTSPTDPDPMVRQAFAMNVIATGKVLATIWPSTPNNLTAIDPMLNVTEDWPPVAIVHGIDDVMIPMRLSKAFEGALQAAGVEVEFFEVQGEGHTFCGKMQRGSRTWETQRLGFDFLERVLQRSYK